VHSRLASRSIRRMTSLAFEIEDAVVDAWPAAECEELDGWWLRASGGPTHRANSVATLSAGAVVPLASRIAQAEAFYRARGLRPMFQVGPMAAPTGLDAALADRGYRIEGVALAAVADPVEVVARLARTHETSVGTRASDAWLQHAGHFADTYDFFIDLLSRLGTRCRFVTARDAGGTVTGTCLGISSEDRLGVYTMLTTPSARRKGTGVALLRALAESALAERIRELYLLVELDNAPARALYTRAGFTEITSITTARSIVRDTAM
jgi:GNAT superfamily N-acetyltransferase